jgi:hypothetical protein
MKKACNEPAFFCEENRLDFTLKMLYYNNRKAIYCNQMQYTFQSCFRFQMGNNKRIKNYLNGQCHEKVGEIMAKDGKMGLN